MAGYSKTPLLKKLGFKKDQVSYVDSHAPYYSQVKENITLGADEPYNFIHIFVKDKEELEKSMGFSLKKLAKNGMLWVSWPKKSAKTATDIDQNTVRDFALKQGVVDVKVAAIDEVWSGFKFMYRIKDR